MNLGLRIPELILSPELLGGGWQAPSFAAHRALVRGVFGGAMSAEEVAAFAQMTGGRAPLARPPRTLVVIKSRRVAGTRIAVAIASALALAGRPAAPGEQPVVRFIAPDRVQAGIAFRYARGSLASSELLAHELTNVTAHRIELANDCALTIATADDAAVRGFTGLALVVDEAAFVPGLAAILSAARPSLATVPHAMLLLVSTPAGAEGPVYELDRRYFGVNDPDTLVVHAHWRLFNPGLADVVRRELEADPYRAPAEWDLQYLVGLSSFVDVALVDSVMRSEPRELPPRTTSSSGARLAYVAAVDPSGGRRDAAAAAVAHREGERIVVDAVRRWPSPHDPAQVAREVGQFLAHYGLASACADQFGAEMARTIYAAAGVTLTDAAQSRSDTYLRALPLMTSNALELPPDPTLRQELLGLERRARTGRDVVDHRPNGHDDVVNAALLAAVRLAPSPAAAHFDPVFIPSTVLDEYHSVAGFVPQP